MVEPAVSSGDAGALSAEARALVARLEALMAGRTDRKDEREILALLAAASPRALSEALVAVDLVRLVGDVDDRLYGGPQNRTKLFDLLARERLSDLSIEARAALVSALQAGRTCSADERAVRDVLCGTSGRALTELKNALDGRGGYRDLHQLLFRDMDDARVRAEVLGHFEQEASRLAPGPRPLKILSDMDDTLYANWKDSRFPKKTVYPGVVAFYRELDLGPSGDDREGDVTFVTARPGDRAGWVEDATRLTLSGFGLPGATVLTGSFRRLLGNENLARKKLENFLEYRALYPEYDFVFNGDSGQADAVFGERMRAACPERVRAVFIHDVVATPEPEREAWATKGVLFYDTYAGAALAAFERGLVSAEGLSRIAQAARDELAKIPFPSLSQAKARESELERDLDRVRAVLPG